MRARDIATECHALYTGSNTLSRAEVLLEYEKNKEDVFHMLRMMADPTNSAYTQSILELQSAPRNQASFHVYWWGYSLYMPPAAVKKLLSVTRGQIQPMVSLMLALAWGPTLPILPYAVALSAYLVLESEMIAMSEKGNGVVVAAAWILPMVYIAWPYEPDQPLGPIKTMVR